MRVVLATAAALAAAMAAPLAAQETISKAEVRSDPPEQTHERLRDVFWDLFPVQDMRSEDAPTMPLAGLSFDTRPRLTQFHNLCQRDRLVVVFDSPGDDAGPDVQQAAQSFTATTFFSFLEMPTGIESRLPHDETDESCATLPADQPFFQSDSEWIALFSHLALVKLQHAIVNDSFEAISCGGTMEKGACAQRIAAIGLADVQNVSGCGDQVDEDCYRINLRPDGPRGADLLIYTHGRPIGQGDTVLRAELRQSMILFHTRPD